jgi:hypothetical protein
MRIECWTVWSTSHDLASIVSSPSCSLHPAVNYRMAAVHIVSSSHLMSFSTPPTPSSTRFFDNRAPRSSCKIESIWLRDRDRFHPPIATGEAEAIGIWQVLVKRVWCYELQPVALSIEVPPIISSLV